MNKALVAELLKVRKRWMPYVLFILLLIGAAVIVWLFGYVGWTDEEDPEFKQNNLRSFLLPWSIPALLDTGQFWGTAMFVSILTASTVATEYSWGTVRQALMRGQTRSQYLAVKLLCLTIVCSVALLLVFAVGVAFSVGATAAADLPITLDVPGGPSVPEIGLMVLRAAMGILPYGLLAFCLTVVGRSTALGFGGTIGYMFGEGILVAILGGIGGIAEGVRPFFIGHNVSSLMAANRIGTLDYNSIAPRELPIASELPDVWVATLVLAVWCVAFLAIAFAVFRRRDVGT